MFCAFIRLDNKQMQKLCAYVCGKILETDRCRNRTTPYQTKFSEIRENFEDVLNEITPSKKLLYIYWGITLQEHGQVTKWT